MTVCEQIRADAPGLASLPPRDPERLSAWSHAAGCEDCARALRQGERLQAILGELQPDPLPAGALERATRAIEEQLRREARRRSAWPAGCAGALVLALVALSSQRGGSPLDWATAGVLAAGALVVASLGWRFPALASAAAVALALCGALVAGGAGPLDLREGLQCLAIELAAAAVVAGAGWAALRGGAASPTRRATIAAAAAGALAGDAALQVTCRAHEIGPHLLAFHVGGVLLAVALASLVRPRVPAAA